jgi:hypothetical protein
MLKFFFWLLLLANVALYGYQQSSMAPDGREPTRVENQLNAEQIQLMPADSPALVPLVSAAAAAETPAEEAIGAPAAPVAPVAPPAAQAPATLACMEVGNFSADEAQRFEASLAPLALGDRVSRRRVRDVLTHIVYIPPLADKAAADKKVAELRQLGVTDYYVIQDNSALRWGISLGVFKQAEAARAHLARLNQMGVRSLRIGERAVAAQLVAFQLRSLGAEAKAGVDRIVAQFPRQDVRSCSPG